MATLLYKSPVQTDHPAGAQLRSRVIARVFALITLALAAAVAPAYGITVTAPASGAHVTSPFSVVASTSTCDSKPAVSMGYSIDSGATTIVSTNFSALVSASVGKHTLHVKCWGVKASGDSLVSITVLPTPIATPAISPVAGTYTSSQSVLLSDATPGAKIYYTTNGVAPSASSTLYTGAIPVSANTEIEAIAIAPGSTSSGLARADFVIKPPSVPPMVPANATAATKIHLLDTWHFNHDAGTPGSAEGESSLVGTPSLSGQSREFASSYTDGGGEIFSVSYANDTTSMNFLYDGWVRIASGSTLANLEMDSNQVTANGDTVIYAFQCSGYSKLWEYSGAGATWVHSSQPCDPSTWTTDAWHHVQISYSRDDSGNVTYHSVWLDGNEQAINATVPSSFPLGWQVGVVQTQFQVDGFSAAGSSVLYLDDLTIYRW
jgi:hypothetical protein